MKVNAYLVLIMLYTIDKEWMKTINNTINNDSYYLIMYNGLDMFNKGM